MRALVLLSLLSALILCSSPCQSATLQTPALFRSGEQDSIPGRQALKLALLTMERANLTQTQRLQLAEPLFQQAIGASEEIDINEKNNDLRDLARQAAESSSEEKERLGPRAVELLETIKQPMQARLLFAVAIQSAAAESNDLSLNHRAIKWLQSIESKDPGARMDVAVQGCLSICQKQPVCAINEEDALTIGQIEVTKNLVAKSREAGEVNWQRIAESAGELLLGMVFCWVVSLLVKSIAKRFRKVRV